MLRELKCPRCGGTLNINMSEQSHAFCPYCGTRFSLDNNNCEYTINQNINENSTRNLNKTTRIIDDAAIIRAKNDSIKNSAGFKITLLILTFALIFFAVIFISWEIQDYKKEQRIEEAIAAGKISAGYYNDYIDKNYEAVVKQLELLGFTNIEAIDLDDSFFLIGNNGEVESISIDGNSSFYKDDYFDPDALIIIKYH